MVGGFTSPFGFQVAAMQLCYIMFVASRGELHNQYVCSDSLVLGKVNAWLLSCHLPAAAC